MLDSAASWIIPVGILGAIVGSFINVVIYRLPLGLSITRPAWSFCPHCRARIRPWDNVPVLAWFYLRGRCRDCRGPIAAVYPVIECATALLFVMVWDALFISSYVPAVQSPTTDWPIAIAYGCLFASLLATAGMDIESYSIDIRVSVFAVVIGIAAYGVWGIPSAVLLPQRDVPTGALPPALCVIGVAMGLTWLLPVLIVGLVARLRGSAGRNGESAEDGGQDKTAGSGPGSDPASSEAIETGSSAKAESPGSAQPTAYADSRARRFQAWPVAAFCLVVVALIVWQVTAPRYQFYNRLSAGAERGFVACFLLMLLLIMASMTPREADREIVEELEEGRHEARPMAFGELGTFIPALGVGVVLFMLLRRSGHLAVTWAEAVKALEPVGRLAPHAAGVLLAMGATVWAAALGWSVRILGTLAFRKEAFGTGDIYILAAIAAVTSLWNLVFGFFLTAFLALIGVTILSFRKSSRAIPFGPWLALGAFAMLWLQKLLLENFGEVGRMLWSLVSGSPMA